MNKNVRRSRSLPAFVMNLTDLKQLCAALLSHVDDDQSTIQIRVEHDGVTYEFESPEEIVTSPELPERSTELSIYIYSTRKTIELRSGYAPGGAAIVTARGESDAWTAGALEIAYRFAERKRRAYHWLFSIPTFALLFFFSGTTLLAALLALMIDLEAPRKLVFGAIGAAFCVLVPIGAVKVFVWSGVTLLFVESQTWLARHKDAVQTISIAVTAVATIAGLILLYFV